MIKNKKLINSIFLSLILLSFSSCSIFSDNSLNSKYGQDANYFIGLRLLSEGKEKEARTKFLLCVKKGTDYCSRRSLEELSNIGSVQERIKYCEKLISSFNDKESMLFCVRQFKEFGETNKIIAITDGIDIENQYDETIRIRLESLQLRNDSRFDEELYLWFTDKSISYEHYKFFRDSYSHTQEEENYSPEEFLFNYRILLYKKDYLQCFVKSAKLLSYIESNEITGKTQIISDLGKAFLYGNNNYNQNATYFENLAKNQKNNQIAFYYWFYAGRMIDKSGINYTKALVYYNNAIECSENAIQKDNALWYLLKMKSKFEFNKLIVQFSDYVEMWDDPTYFDDFFDELINSLFLNGDWPLFYEIYKKIDGWASKETVARFAYLSARLIDLGFIKVENGDEIKKGLFEAALNSGTDFYYRLLSAYYLNLSENELESHILRRMGDNKKEEDLSLEILLKGYCDFGFPDKLYDELEKVDKSKISTECIMNISLFLNNCSTEANEYGQQSIRIASKEILNTSDDFSIDYLKLVYPKIFSNYVDTYSEKYDINKSTIFALIRSESFFDPDVISHAGAIGLTQLMDFTGEDIARKLHKEEYSLTNPEDNIEFGTYYLSEMKRRCDDSILQAFFSYNAGITRVRRWLKSSLQEMGQKKDIPGDLFLETIPYEETREYGRKLVSASLLYEWIYSETPKDDFTKMIEYLMY